ncbi:MAG: CHASE4 domain-containing protein [Candidatus Acidiferrales bacterium]
MPSSLRGKTRLIILLTTVALVGGLYALSRAILLHSFVRLEDNVARENLARASSALENELTTLDHSTTEYASWDQTYSYLHGTNPGYLNSEYVAPTFEQVRIDFVAIFDDSGNLLFSRAVDKDKKGFVPLPADLLGHLKAGSLLLDRSSETNRTSGIVMLASGPMLIDAQPILTSESRGPAAGTLVFGRLLDAAVVQQLADTTHLPVEIELLDGGTARNGRQKAAEGAATARTSEIRRVNEDTIAASEPWNDIYGRPAILLRIVEPRTIYMQGQASLLQFLLMLLAAGLALGSVTLYLLESVVLSRVANLSEDVTQIGASGDLSERLEVSGRDELAFLGNAINGMLEDLERSQRERREGRTRLALMIERMPAVLWTTDTELRFTSGMGAGLEVLGVRPEEMTGKSLFEYFRTDDPDFPPIAAHRRALAGHSVTYEQEWQNRLFESHVQTLRGPDGELAGVIGVALDITDRKKLTDQLRQSQKMQAVGELAGGIAHDFNNLLMVMKGHAEMLLDQLSDGSPMRQNVVQVQKAAERAANLTRQLLAFSRRQVLQARVLDLNEIVAGMIQMFSRVIGENIEMAFLPGSRLGRVKADPSQVEQVLINLVVNARDAMPEGGRLTIETSNVELDRNYAARHAGMVPGHYVMMVVSDTGSGMDAATQARIFEPFFTTKGPGKGTGLGLATVYGVVKQSGGFIWVYSELGHGTSFKVYLPEVAAEAERISTEKPAERSQTGSETILFVEDEESVRELVSEYLKNAGYNVLEAIDGAQALEVAQAHQSEIHILVTDVVMPRVSGRELATRLTATRTALKVLYVSGYTDDSIFRHGVLEGGMAFLQKPFNLKTLAQKIRAVLDGEAAGVAEAKLDHSARK